MTAQAAQPPALGVAAESPSAQPPSIATVVVRKFVGGTVGGVLQAGCSHPFDTIKSRIQNGAYPGIAACVRGTMKNEGLVGFYRGVTPPLAMAGVYNSLLFSINQFMVRLLTPSGQPPGERLAVWRVAVAGQLTAPLIVAVLCPMEVIKVRLQVQPQGEGRLYRGLWDCVAKTVSREGVRALWKGYLPTLGTRFFGLPAYFVAYEKTREAFETHALAPEQRAAPPSYVFLVSGTMAGFSFWTSCYPFDFIKTKVQASPQHGPLHFVRETLATRGIRGFYGGFGACLLRSTPANSSVWLGMEHTTRLMERNGW